MGTNSSYSSCSEKSNGPHTPVENYRALQFPSAVAYIQQEEARTLANVSSAQNLHALQHARLAEATDARRYMSGNEADPLF